MRQSGTLPSCSVIPVSTASQGASPICRLALSQTLSWFLCGILHIIKLYRLRFNNTLWTVRTGFQGSFPLRFTELPPNPEGQGFLTRDIKNAPPPRYFPDSWESSPPSPPTRVTSLLSLSQGIVKLEMIVLFTCQFNSKLLCECWHGPSIWTSQWNSHLL